jgi:hypothetical protein
MPTRDHESVSGESLIQGLFLRSRGESSEEQLRGKMVMLDNARSQSEQQQQQVRQRRELGRKRRRVGQKVPEESGARAQREAGHT